MDLSQQNDTETQALDGRVRRVHLLETSERYIAIKRSGLVLGLDLIAESLPVACDVRCPHVK